MKFDYSDYNVIVTGGTRGIGRAVTKAFLDAGAAVTAVYAGNEKAAAELMSERGGNGRLTAAKLDISNYAEVEAFFEAYDKKYDSLEVLVNNAGIRRDGVVGMMPQVDWQSVIDTNLTGTFNMSKFALMKMLQHKFGRVIAITSPSGKMGFAGQANYAASKAGQVAFMKSLSKEAARRSITANCVSPGFIDTELIADLPEDVKKQYANQVPLRRFGTPIEVASSVLFLAARESSYITGSVL
ncbi:MAG: 3-oxoacyl-ACP reductase FabG, partial [Victivallales bacterium]|nr:3-oxoacyl-ACP reductase FabG [Victivallales bacterium]